MASSEWNEFKAQFDEASLTRDQVEDLFPRNFEKFTKVTSENHTAVMDKASQMREYIAARIALSPGSYLAPQDIADRFNCTKNAARRALNSVYEAFDLEKPEYVASTGTKVSEAGSLLKFLKTLQSDTEV